MILYAILLFVGMIALGLLFYIFLLPDPEQPIRPFHSWEKYVGRGAYSVAYVLSLLRAPLGLLPYMVKLFIFFVLNIRCGFRLRLVQYGNFCRIGVGRKARWRNNTLYPDVALLVTVAIMP